jgi:hypothetical protein
MVAVSASDSGEDRGQSSGSGNDQPPAPRDDAPDRRDALFPTVLLAVSAVLVAIAPAFVPDSYSWIEHSTSESAGQLVDGSWVARTGFLCLGCAALWLAHLRARARMWGAVATFAHRVFGVSMIATAVFATRPWLASAPYD